MIVSDKTTSNNDVIDQFWDLYQEEGIVTAVDYIRNEADGDLSVLETSVPYLVEEAKTRSIDIIDFLQELDDHMEKTDASGTDNGSDELPSDSDSEASEPQDEDGTSEARDADGESGSGEEGA